MAFSSLSSPPLPLLFHHQKPNLPFLTSNFQTSFGYFPQLSTLNPKHHQKMSRTSPMKVQGSVNDLGIVERAIQLVQSSPPTWQSALLSNIIIFTVGSPLLVSGLSLSGIGAAFLLGTLTWRAFGSNGFLLVATYFVILLDSSLSSSRLPLLFHCLRPKLSFFTSNLQTPFDYFPQLLTLSPRHHKKMSRASSMKVQGSANDLGIVERAIQLVQSSPPTWKSALLSYIIIFTVGSPLLVSGLSLSGIGAAFLLGTLTWRAFGANGFLLVATYFVIYLVLSLSGIGAAFLLGTLTWHAFGSSGFLLVATYFVIGTAATKVKMAQKEAQGVAEKRKGRRGPGSVLGSSAAGCVCAFLSINGVGGEAFTRLWELAFVASFCTKLSDTISSEIGKAYGKTTYLVTTFKVVPPGTEGAVSAEGTLAGLLASVLLAFVGYLTGQINVPGAAICVIAAQIANFGESLIGASLQDKEGFRWLNNDVVNVINISLGSIFAVLMQKIILQS